MRRRKSTPSKRTLPMPQAGAGLDLREAVIRALEDDRYDWRTVGGIARSLNVKNQEVLDVFNSLPDQIVRATAEDGQSLFTTRRHYEKTQGFSNKLLSALADKVVA